MRAGTCFFVIQTILAIRDEWGKGGEERIGELNIVLYILARSWSRRRVRRRACNLLASRETAKKGSSFIKSAVLSIKIVWNIVSLFFSFFLPSSIEFETLFDVISRCKFART